MNHHEATQDDIFFYDFNDPPQGDGFYFVLRRFGPPGEVTIGQTVLFGCVGDDVIAEGTVTKFTTSEHSGSEALILKLERFLPPTRSE